MSNKELFVYTAQTLQRMRLERGLSVEEFWGAMGYKTSRGYHYEAGKSKIPEHVRRLVHLHYVLGVPTDPDSAEQATFMKAIEEQQPIRLNNVVKKLERGIGLMTDTLSELKK